MPASQAPADSSPTAANALPPVPSPPVRWRIRRHLTRRLARRLAVSIAGSLGLYTLLGFVVIPWALRRVLETKLSEALHRKTTIRRVALNPYSLALTVQGFAMQDKGGGPFLAFEELFLDFEALSVVKGGVILRDIILRSPSVSLVRVTEQSYSVSDLIEEFGKPSPEDAKPGKKAAVYSLNNIRILGGSIDIDDRPKKATHSVRDLNVGVPFLSTLPYDLESYVQPALSAKVNGTAFELKGRTKPFSSSRETTLDIDLSGLVLPKYMEYVPVPLRFTVPSGVAFAKVSLSFDQPVNAAPALRVSGTMGLTDLRIDDLAGQPVLQLPAFGVTLASTNVLGLHLTVEEVRIEKPVLHVTKAKDGTLNLTELGPVKDGKEAKETPKPAEDSNPLVAEVKAVHLVDGTVHFSDAGAQGGFATTLLGLAVDVKDFSTEAGKGAKIEARARTERDEAVRLNVDAVLAPLRVDGHVEAVGVVLRKYAPFYASSVLLDVDEGTLDIKSNFALMLDGKSPRGKITAVETTLSKLAVHKRGEKGELLYVESLQVKDFAADLAARGLTVGDVACHKGRVRVSRATNGVLNLATLVPPPPFVPHRTPEPTPVAAPAAPWTVAVKKLGLDEWSVRIEDRVPARPVTMALDGLAVTVDDFALAKGQKMNVSVRTRLNRTAQVSAAGSVVLDPLAVSLKVDARSLDLLALQPYFTDQVNILLTSGVASANGTLTLGPGKEVSIHYNGRAGIDKLAAVDKQTSEDLFRWDSLFFAGVDLATEPASLSVAEVSMSSFYSKVGINADGSLNLRNLVVAAPVAAARAPLPAGPPMPVRVDKVTLQGGTVEFSDHTVKPTFSASLHEVGGRISGLSSDDKSLADMDLRAKLEDYAPLEISGKVNPLSKELAVDLKVSFKDIDVSPLSPYSGKYVGYNISKGKLFLDLKYTIANKKLEAKNTVFVDQLTLGDSVESRDATRLPVRLALALLRDRHGEIHLDLPLTGSLDDPKFSVGALIIQVLTNVIVKAATAPFAFLGSLVGHGEELSYLEFDEGRSTIGKQGDEKLKSLAKALVDRPSLKLDVTGHVDLARDREGRRRMLFERKVKSQKVKDLSRQGLTVATSVDDVPIDPKEHDRYLKLAYEDETFPKPRNMLGIAKDLPPQEMEKLILTHVIVADDDLRTLGEQRAQEAKEHLVKAGVATERIFLVESRAKAPAKKEGSKDCRVDFVLK